MCLVSMLILSLDLKGGRVDINKGECNYVPFKGQKKLSGTNDFFNGTGAE